MMTHDEMIAVIKAHKEGKKIQDCPYYKDVWMDIPEKLLWNFNAYKYRVKPEPREWWLCGNWIFASKEQADTYFENSSYKGGLSVIHVREVIES